eukprot:1160453-Pelagomonas_calceolata.AAC.12
MCPVSSSPCCHAKSSAVTAVEVLWGLGLCLGLSRGGTGKGRWGVENKSWGCSPNTSHVRTWPSLWPARGQRGGVLRRVHVCEGKVGVRSLHVLAAIRCLRQFFKARRRAMQ